MSDSPKLQDPEKLLLKRREAGLNQRDLASRTGFEQSHISKLERGACSTTEETLARLARALGCDVADLLADPPATVKGKAA